MCVLCVQEIARLQGVLERPFTSVERRRELQEQVQGYENAIKSYKSGISSRDADTKQHQAAMAALQGEPFCVGYQLAAAAELARGSGGGRRH